MSVPISDVQKIYSDSHKVLVEIRNQVLLASDALTRFDFLRNRGLLSAVDDLIALRLGDIVTEINALEDLKVKAK